MTPQCLTTGTPVYPLLKLTARRDFTSMQNVSAGKICPVSFARPEPARRWQQPCIARARDLAQWPISPALASSCPFYLVDEVSRLDEHQEKHGPSSGCWRIAPRGRVCKTCELHSHLYKQADGAALTRVLVSHHWASAPTVFLGCLISNKLVVFFQQILFQSGG